LYETLWACNQCIILAAIGCFTKDSFLIRTVLVLLGFDLLMWYFYNKVRYIDLGGYILKKKFYIGVAKYIIWE
jgi:hypothetical protein